MNIENKFAPYDRCDYRCDTCIHTQTCSLFQQETADEQYQFPFLDQAELDIEEVITNVKISLIKTLQALQENAEKFGIDIKELNDVEFEAPPSPENFPLYQLAYQFTVRCHQFLTDYWDAAPPEEEIENLKPELDDLSWQHTLVSVKLARALISQWDGDDFGAVDAKNSAQVALRALNLCRLSMGNILTRYSVYFDALIDLIILANKIEKSIIEQFNDLRLDI